MGFSALPDTATSEGPIPHSLDMSASSFAVQAGGSIRALDGGGWEGMGGMGRPVEEDKGGLKLVPESLSELQSKGFPVPPPPVLWFL